MSLPVLEKCCYCIPLRRGLLYWGYAKLVFSLLILLNLTIISIPMSEDMSPCDSAVIFLRNIGSSMPDMLDLGFTIVLIIAIHKRNLKMMQVYYYYSITMLAVYILVILLAAFKIYPFHILYAMVFQFTWAFILAYYTMLIAGVMFTFVQAYFILLVRSEVHNLYNMDSEENISRQKSSASFKPIGTLPPPTPATQVVNITTDI